MKYLELRKGRTNKASEGLGCETKAIKMFVKVLLAWWVIGLYFVSDAGQNNEEDFYLVVH